jgi:hypothetical protein
MRHCARLASIKLTRLTRTSATGRTTDSKDLFWAEFFLHGIDIAVDRMPQTHVQEWSILDSSGNYLAESVSTIPPFTLVLKAPFLDSLSPQTGSPPKVGTVSSCRRNRRRGFCPDDGPTGENPAYVRAYGRLAPEEIYPPMVYFFAWPHHDGPSGRSPRSVRH